MIINSNLWIVQDAILDRILKIELIIKLLPELPKLERKVFFLRAGGRPFKKIASNLNKTVDAVKQANVRAIRKLREMVEKLEKDGEEE
jgi:DNA-directed RNA polymerase specialized sigma24 family protein